MFFDSKNQCCENGYTTQSHLQIQYNLHKITNTISTKWPFFTELEQKAVQFVWKHTHTTPPPQIIKTILRKENRAAGIKLSDFRL